MLLGVEPPPFSIVREEVCNSGTLKRRIATMKQYADICYIGLNLVRRISTDLYTELNSVVCQYFVTICVPCKEEFVAAAARFLDQSEQITDALDNLAEHYANVQRRLGEEYQSWSHQARPWKDKTVFDIVNSALVILASRYGLQLGSHFSELGLRDDDVREWLRQIRNFTPHVACFSEKECAVATTYAHWDGWRVLEEWEKGVRSAAIDPVVRDEAARAQGVLEKIVQEQRDVSPQELVRHGIAALERQLDFFRDCGDFGPWWAMQCTTLEHKDQCPSCRCMFRHSQNLQENSPPKDQLGKNREPDRACQCAEVALFSLLLDCALQDSVATQRVVGRLAAMTLRCFGYSAPKQKEQTSRRRWSH